MYLIILHQPRSRALNEFRLPLSASHNSIPNNTLRSCLIWPLLDMVPCLHWWWCIQVRADLNVPLNKDLEITDDTRIRAAIPTLKYLTDNGAKVLLTSHLVRSDPQHTPAVISAGTIFRPGENADMIDSARKGQSGEVML